MRRFLIVLGWILLAVTGGLAQSVVSGGGGSGDTGGGLTVVTSNPATCTTGTQFYNTTSGQTLVCTATNTLTPAPASPTTSVVQTGLMAEYRMLPTETCAALTDYSGKGRNATGTVGVAPTIISGTGGCNFTGNGAISVPAALSTALSMEVFYSYTKNGAGALEALVSGSGASANSVNLIMGNDLSAFFSSCPAIAGARPSAFAGNAFNYLIQNFVDGNNFLTWTLGTAAQDQFYLGNYKYVAPLFNNVGSGGTMTVGNFQIGGGAVGAGTGVQTYLTGKIYYVLFYDHALSQTEVNQNAAVVQAAMQARGISLTNNISAATDNLEFMADSIICGFNLTPTTTLDKDLVLNGTWNITNAGVVAATDAAMINDPQGGLFFAPNAGKNLIVEAMGSNDIFVGVPASTVHAQAAAYDRAQRALGFRVCASTLIDRSTMDAGKNAFNALRRQFWPTYADCLVDPAADPAMGADGASATAAIFPDGVHLSQAATYNNYAPVHQRSINRFYGNRDWTTAATYTATQVAPVATTAGSEATNTMTFTFGATPANCLAGNAINITGTTPAGYSSVWNILTRSATQVTAYNNTTGLGAITIQGTGQCPTQQDADMYTLLGGSTSGLNFLMESGIGYTTQNLYFRNTNTGNFPWVITPWGTETINGLSGYILPPAQTVCLQSVLISQAAGGQKWQTCETPTTTQTVVTSGTAYTNATTGFTSVVGNAGQTLAFPVLASTQYQMTCNLQWQTATATAGPKFQITGPGSPTSVAISVMQAVTATSDGTFGVTAFSTPLTASGASVATGAQEPATITMGLVNGVNAGTVTLQAAAQGAGTLQINPGSYCTMTQIQ